jgi:hypothetical protein
MISFCIFGEIMFFEIFVEKNKFFKIKIDKLNSPESNGFESNNSIKFKSLELGDHLFKEIFSNNFNEYFPINLKFFAIKEIKSEIYL